MILLLLKIAEGLAIGALVGTFAHWLGMRRGL
jgi:putative effector of murein hydrolase